MMMTQPGSVVRLEAPAHDTSSFSLPADEVHVWQSAMGDSPVSGGDSPWRGRGPWADFLMLSEAEQERAARFRRELDQARFIHAHVLLRSVLAGYTQRHPAELRFTASAFGKPALDGQEGAAALTFSLTHAGDLALVAVTRGQTVGVDVEQLRPDLPHLRLAERLFAPEEAAVLRSLPADGQLLAFFNGWTRKEAVVKATGEGMARPFNRFTVTLAPNEPPALLTFNGAPVAAGQWSLHALEPGEGYAGALAVAGQPRRVRFRRWPAAGP